MEKSIKIYAKSVDIYGKIHIIIDRYGKVHINTQPEGQNMANYEDILKQWKDTHSEDEREELQDSLDEIQDWLDELDTDEATTPEELAFQLTAYENGFYIDFDKWLDDQLKSKLHDMDDDELVTLHNEACGFDDYIWDDLEEMLEGDDTMTAINRIWYGRYEGGTIGYYQFNGYANIVEDWPSNLIDESACVKALRDQLDELSNEARAVVVAMAVELVKHGY